MFMKIYYSYQGKEYPDQEINEWANEMQHLFFENAKLRATKALLPIEMRLILYLMKKKKSILLTVDAFLRVAKARKAYA